MAKNRKVPVESRRGADEALFELDSWTQMMAHAPVREVAEGMRTVRQQHNGKWSIDLIQLRGHDWTIVEGHGYFPDDEARDLSEYLGKEVVLFACQDTAGCEIVWIFDSGQDVFYVDNLDGIRHGSSKFPSELDEYDVKAHLDHYLIAKEAYFPCVYHTPRGLVASDLSDEDILTSERLPGE